MNVAAAKALEERIELLVILGPGVLALPEPGPEVLPDVVVVVRADLSEIASPPAADVLGDLKVTVQEEPLGDGAFRKARCTLGRACHAPGCSATKSRSR